MSGGHRGPQDATPDCYHPSSYPKPLRRNGFSIIDMRGQAIMPIGNTGWYRTVFQVDPAGPVGQLTFDPYLITWPFATAGLSVLRTRISGTFWWWYDGPNPWPGPAKGYLPVGVQVQFRETDVVGPGGTIPNIDDVNIENRYRATINEAIHLDQVFITAYDGAPDLPFEWMTLGSISTEVADSKGQRHFDSGRQLHAWVTVGPINHWVVDLIDSPSFACALAMEVLVGEHT